ncbi:hypothetical protein SCBWM1_gp68 [Synechococcus phage S-CBWM1]|uniref:Uncharacterized protein n=1 Tax=Synechococcus phage S-CBWM1 TaxID=2053653 RepID=A0A3G1L3I9_9CAUD|nr:hypothetical protein HOU61_gp129 [Synechococcus phage S-CBWM1]ATW62752.1 hypothetical protein SCBWM1_gp68 [Synechococcus phage S-CBWM1]
MNYEEVLPRLFGEGKFYLYDGEIRVKSGCHPTEKDLEDIFFLVTQFGYAYDGSPFSKTSLAAIGIKTITERILSNPRKGDEENLLVVTALQILVDILGEYVDGFEFPVIYSEDIRGVIDKLRPSGSSMVPEVKKDPQT